MVFSLSLGLVLKLLQYHRRVCVSLSSPQKGFLMLSPGDSRLLNFKRKTFCGHFVGDVANHHDFNLPEYHHEFAAGMERTGYFSHLQGRPSYGTVLAAVVQSVIFVDLHLKPEEGSGKECTQLSPGTAPRCSEFLLWYLHRDSHMGCLCS